jgi:hypothetical protein
VARGLSSVRRQPRRRQQILLPHPFKNKDIDYFLKINYLTLHFSPSRQFPFLDHKRQSSESWFF